MKRYRYIILPLFFLFILLIAGCKKDQKTPITPPDGDNEIVIPEDQIEVKTENLVVNPDAKVILTEDWSEFFTISDSVNGVVQTSPELLQKYGLKEGTILVSGEHDGFLRKIKQVDTSEDKIVIKTEFCAMEELFQEGSFTIRVKDDTGTKSGQVDITKGLSVELSADMNFVDLKGKYTLAEQIEFSASFQNYALQNLNFSYAIINELEFNAGIMLGGKGSKSIILGYLPKIRAIVGGFPVVITPVIAIAVGAEITGKPAPLDFNFTTGFEAKVAMKYDGQWDPSASFDCFQDFAIPELKLNDETNSKIKVYVGPEIQFRFYGVVAPYFNITAYGQIEGRYTGNPAWVAYAGSEISGGVRAKIFKRNLFDISTSFFEVKLPVLYAENMISIASGNNQIGIAGKLLANPLAAKITNALGYPLSGYKVDFNIVSGGGTINPESAVSNNSGEAATTLKLGYENIVIVEASASERNNTPHNGAPLKNAPIRFNADINTGNSHITISISDITFSSAKAFIKLDMERIAQLLSENIQTVGVCYSSTANNPDFESGIVQSTTFDPSNSIYDINLSNLSPETTYRIRGFVKAPSGDYLFGDVVEFKTLKESDETLENTAWKLWFTIPEEGTYYVGNLMFKEENIVDFMAEGEMLSGEWSMTDRNITIVFSYRDGTYYQNIKLIGIVSGSIIYGEIHVQDNVEYYNFEHVGDFRAEKISGKNVMQVTPIKKTDNNRILSDYFKK